MKSKWPKTEGLTTNVDFLFLLTSLLSNLVEALNLTKTDGNKRIDYEHFVDML